MISPLQIPQSIDSSKPDRMRVDLDRLLQRITAWADELLREVKQRMEVGEIVTTGTAKCAFGRLTRVAPLEDYTVTVTLPKPQTTDGGKSLSIARLSWVGTVNIVAPQGCAVNTFRSVQMTAAPSFVEVLFDGTNYWTNPPQCQPWGAGL